jgi:hypothetical protein
MEKPQITQIDADKSARRLHLALKAASGLRRCPLSLFLSLILVADCFR